MKLNWFFVWNRTQKTNRQSRTGSSFLASLSTESLEIRCLLSATGGLDCDHGEHEDGQKS